MVTWPLNFLASYIIERFGRRQLFIIVASFVSAELLFTTTAQILVDFHGGSLDGNASICPFPFNWIIPGLAILGQIAQMTSWSLGLITMVTILVTDLCPHSLRALITQVNFVLKNK